MYFTKLTSSIKKFTKDSLPSVTSIQFFSWIGLAALAGFVGLFITIFSYREGIDMGDGSTFYQFAHNIANGEVIYKDFIHFRTPGSYFLQSIFLTVFGDFQSSLRFALGFESRVLYVPLFVIGMAIFLKFKHIAVGVAATGVVILLPAYAQLRTVLAFLAVILFIQAYRAMRHKNIWLFISGIFIGLAFTFGQEAAVMAVATIGLIEVVMWLRSTHAIKQTLTNLGLISLGVFVGVLPLLVYVLIKSDLGTFLYYTLYYAFVLQPKGMDLAYPIFGYDNLIFYIPFLLILISFYIFFTKRSTLGLAGVALLSFMCLRLVTLLGRSDVGHLIFILPELLFVSILSIYYVKSASFNIRDLKKFIPYCLALIVVFLLAINVSTLLIILSVVVITLAMFSPEKITPKLRINNNIAYVTLGILTGTIGVLIYLIYPFYVSTFQSMSRRGITDTQVGGVNVTDSVFKQVNEIHDSVRKIDPEVIFAYPIQPYYYSLAPEHATRFMTFEPQTTEHEQDLTIQDLKRSRPEVVVFDPAQAVDMSKSLWKINEYIMSEYEIYKVSTGERILWVMTKKEEVDDKSKPLTFVMYKNGFNLNILNDIQSPEKGIFNAISQKANSNARFNIEGDGSGYTFKTSIYYNDTDNLGTCGKIKIEYSNGAHSEYSLCAGAGLREFILGRHVKSIVLTNDTARQLVWNDPVLSTSRK